jgi:hypothetical protein
MLLKVANFFLENLTVTVLVKKFPILYGTRKILAR